MKRYLSLGILLTATLAGGCDSHTADAVANNFRAMYLCQDHGGFREIRENRAQAFTVECKDGLVIYGGD